MKVIITLFQVVFGSRCSSGSRLPQVTLLLNPDNNSHDNDESLFSFFFFSPLRWSKITTRFTRTLFCFSSPRRLCKLSSVSRLVSQQSLLARQYTGVMSYSHMCDVASNSSKNSVFRSTRRTSLSRLHLNFLPPYRWLIVYTWLCHWLLDEYTFSAQLHCARLWHPSLLVFFPQTLPPCTWEPSLRCDPQLLWQQGKH